MVLSRDAKYVAIQASIGAIVGFIILFWVFSTSFGFDKTTNQNAELLLFMVFIIIMIFSVILILSISSLIKEKRRMEISPPYYTDSYTTSNSNKSEFMPCPKCGGNYAEKVDYSWWGGWLGPKLVNQVRCKRCGMAYNGKIGKSISRKVYTYIIFTIILIVILIILRLLD